MQREDYLMRMIREFGQTLGSILKLVMTQQEHAALATITQLIGRLLGVPKDELRAFSLREVPTYLTFTQDTPLERQRRAALARLLVEAGAIYTKLQRRDDAYSSYLQALRLLLDLQRPYEEAALLDPHCADHGEPLPDYTPALAELDTALRPYALPTDLYQRLFDYYLGSKSYARAEDVLFTLRTAEPNSSTVADLGLGFYRQLQQRDDADLVAGNLPREEVDEGLVLWEAQRL